MNMHMSLKIDTGSQIQVQWKRVSLEKFLAGIGQVYYSKKAD